MNKYKIPLSDDILNRFAELEQRADDTRWEFGAILDSTLEAVQNELQGTVSKRDLKQYLGNVTRQAAEAANIQRSTASDRLNMWRFYGDSYNDYPFSYHQFRAIRKAGDDWRNFADDILKRMDKYGGTVATVEAIRELAKERYGKADDTPSYIKQLLKACNRLDGVLDNTDTPEELVEPVDGIAQALYALVPEEYRE